MTVELLLILLSIGTIAVGTVVAIVSKKKTDARKRDPEAPKSTLAADAPNSRSR